MDRPIMRSPIFKQSLPGLFKLKEGDNFHAEAIVEPANDSSLTVDWLKDGKSLTLGSRITTYCDFGFVSIDIWDVKTEDSGTYTCRVSNNIGEAVSKCTIKVQGFGNIDQRSLHPESWQRIQEIECPQRQTYEYRTEAYGEPHFTSRMTNLELEEGDTAHFECTIEPARDPSLTVEFLHNGKLVPSGSRYALTQDFGYVTFDVAYVYPQDSGIYKCIVSNNNGQTVSSASLNVRGNSFVDSRSYHPFGEEGLRRIQEIDTRYQFSGYLDERREFQTPFFVQQLQLKCTIEEGQSLHLECRVEPSNDPSLNVEWFVNDRPLMCGSRYAIINDFGYVVMDIKDLWPRDNGIYTCKATNNSGEAVTRTEIRVIPEGAVIDRTIHPGGLQSIQRLEEFNKPIYQY